MYPLIFIIIALLVVALYPIIRDFIRQRRVTTPAYVEGLQLLLDGAVKEAIVKLKQAVQEDTSNVDAYIRLGNIFYQQGEIERALRIHESLALRRNLKPQEERRIYQALVKDYLKSERTIKALPLLEELIRIDKSDIESRERLLDLLIENGSWEKCESLLKETPPKPPEKVARLYALFGSAYGKVNPKKGSHWLEEGLKLYPQSRVALLLMGDLLFHQGEVENAIKVWHRILENNPDKNFLVRRRLEEAYYELGRYEEIVQLYRRLQEKTPQDSGLAVALAKIYAKKEDWAEAIRILEPFAKQKELLPSLLLALFLLKQGETQRAEKFIEEIIGKLEQLVKVCAKCKNPLPETEIRCPQCRTWQDD